MHRGNSQSIKTTIINFVSLNYIGANPSFCKKCNVIVNQLFGTCYNTYISERNAIFF